MASTAALDILIKLQGAAEASGGLADMAKNALSFAAGGLIQKGIEGVGSAIGDLFTGSIDEAKQAEAGMAQLDAVLKSTGGSAGVTKDQVLALADSLSSAGGLSTATDDAVLQGENMLLTFTNIGKDVFPGATQTMLDMATAMNNGATPSAEQLSAQAIQLGKALNDPSKGLTALTRVGVTFTNEQKSQIQSMQKATDAAGAYSAVFGELPGDMGELLKGVHNTGDAMKIMATQGVDPLTEEQKRLFDSILAGNGTMEAQKVILTELGKEFGGSAAAAADTFDGKMAHLSGVFDNVKQSIGEKLLPILSGFMDWLGSPGVMNAIQGLADGLINGISKGIEFVSNAVQAIMPYIQPFIDNIMSFWTTIASGGDPFQALGGYISNLFGLLGDLGGKILAWIGDQLPGIMSKLGEWGMALWQWVVDTVPVLLGKLGELIGSILSWIGENGPTILAKLAEWTGAFLSWALTDLLPKLLEWLGQIIGGIWNWITTNGPTILAKLAEWTQAFFSWIFTDVLPKLPGWLGSVINAVWTFITENGPTILAKLGEWTGAFLNWVFTDVLPKIPGWLANIAGALWTFITENAPVLLEKLGELTGKFLAWVMDIVGKIPGWFADVAKAIWDWVSQTAKDVVGKVADIGKGILQGIMDGLGGAAKAIGDFLMGIAKGIWEAIVKFFTGGANEYSGSGPSPGAQHAGAGGGKAAGGPVYGGRSYLVGERGPELFVPSGSGSIIPNGRLGGGGLSIGTVVIQAAPGTDGALVAQRFVEGLEEELGVTVRMRNPAVVGV